MPFVTKSKLGAFLTILVCSSALTAQQNYLPRPYILVGPTLESAGYAPLGSTGTTGVRIDGQHFLLDTNVWYDTARKTDDNDQPNPKGHTRGAVVGIYFRMTSRWAFGTGARWSQLSTTNYKKNGWRPTIGGSKDLFVKDCIKEDCAGATSMRGSASTT